jgi:ammonia channel protein AmtB
MAIDPEIEQYINDAVNGLWVFVAGIICFLLQAGFGLLEVGNVRAKVRFKF